MWRDTRHQPAELNETWFNGNTPRRQGRTCNTIVEDLGNTSRGRHDARALRVHDQHRPVTLLHLPQHLLLRNMGGDATCSPNALWRQSDAMWALRQWCSFWVRWVQSMPGGRTITFAEGDQRLLHCLNGPPSRMAGHLALSCTQIPNGIVCPAQHWHSTVVLRETSSIFWLRLQSILQPHRQTKRSTISRFRVRLCSVSAMSTAGLRSKKRDDGRSAERGRNSGSASSMCSDLDVFGSTPSTRDTATLGNHTQLVSLDCWK